MSRIIYWEPWMTEDSLWVCIHCGAELNSDCVGLECPACGETVDEEEAI